VLIVDTKSDLNIYCWEAQDGVDGNGCCGGIKSSTAPGKERIDDGAANTANNASPEIDYNDCAGSFKIYAVKK
jgi:hypothetical protein